VSRSPRLTAIGLPPEEARAVSDSAWGVYTTSATLIFALNVVPAAVAHYRCYPRRSKVTKASKRAGKGTINRALLEHMTTIPNSDPLPQVRKNPARPVGRGHSGGGDSSAVPRSCKSRLYRRGASPSALDQRRLPNFKAPAPHAPLCSLDDVYGKKKKSQGGISTLNFPALLW